MPAHPVIQTAPHHSILPAIDLECLPRLAVEFFYKGLVMPIIVVLFHSCNFSAKLQLYQNPVNASSWRQILFYFVTCLLLLALFSDFIGFVGSFLVHGLVTNAKNKSANPFILVWLKIIS